MAPWPGRVASAPAPPQALISPGLRRARRAAEPIPREANDRLTRGSAAAGWLIRREAGLPAASLAGCSTPVARMTRVGRERGHFQAMPTSPTARLRRMSAAPAAQPESSEPRRQAQLPGGAAQAWRSRPAACSGASSAARRRQNAGGASFFGGGHRGLGGGQAARPGEGPLIHCSDEYEKEHNYRK